jgi:hypothetical protein
MWVGAEKFSNEIKGMGRFNLTVEDHVAHPLHCSSHKQVLVHVQSDIVGLPDYFRAVLAQLIGDACKERFGSDTSNSGHEHGALKVCQILSLLGNVLHLTSKLVVPSTISSIHSHLPINSGIMSHVTAPTSPNHSSS